MKYLICVNDSSLESESTHSLPIEKYNCVNCIVLPDVYHNKLVFRSEIYIYIYIFCLVTTISYFTSLIEMHLLTMNEAILLYLPFIYGAYTMKWPTSVSYLQFFVGHFLVYTVMVSFTMRS